MKANTISGQRQYAFVSQFNYIREAGTEGEEKAACRIEKELSEIAEKWGQGELQIRREPFEIETWQVDEAVFTVTEPYEKTYTVRGCFAAANTAPEGVEAPFLYVENGDPVSLSHAEGKIVLINGGANAENYEELEKAGEYILRVTDFYYQLQKVVNAMYALSLANCHKREESALYEHCREVLMQVAEGSLNEEGLVKLEGKIETYVEKSSYLEAVLFEIKSSHKKIIEELGKGEEFDAFAKIANLLSDSLFIDMERFGENDTVEAAAEAEKIKELTGELSDFLSTLSKPLKKAVMAEVLEKLPVEFTNAGEIETYIRTNLFGCQNEAEKKAAMMELREWMDEAAEWRSE